jgi:hypothetical protein
VVGALATGLVAWGILLGALLVLAYSMPRAPRAWWMLVFLMVACTGPMLSLLLTGPLSDQPDFGWWWMTSPVTTGFELARDRPWSGAAAAVGTPHWAMLAGIGGFGLACWVLLILAGLLRRSRAA